MEEAADAIKRREYLLRYTGAGKIPGARHREREKVMLRDITLGQYYPADSVIHKLDPESKAGRHDGVYHFPVCFSTQ